MSSRKVLTISTKGSNVKELNDEQFKSEKSSEGENA
jgi:hypothetical protein